MTTDKRNTRPGSLDDLLAKRDQAAKDAQVRYLTGDEKEAWAAANTSFIVKSVDLGEGDYGSRWELVVAAEGDDEDRIMTISRNRARDPLMRELQRLSRQAEQGPLQFDTVELEGGRTFQWFKRPGTQSDSEVKQDVNRVHGKNAVV